MATTRLGSAGDLFTVPAKASSRAAPSDEKSYEIFPRFSPDGKAPPCAFNRAIHATRCLCHYAAPMRRAAPAVLTYNTPRSNATTSSAA